MRRARIQAGNPAVAVAYLRASTEEQKLGLDVQRQAIEAWATRDGVVMAHWCTDELPGGLPIAERPMLGQALAALRVYKAGVLVAFKRDRLHRDVPTAVAIEHAAREAGAVVHTLDGVAGGQDPYSNLQRTVLDAFAQFERDLIRMRIKGALQLKKQRGEVYTHPPFGYRVQDGRLVPCLEERALAKALQSIRNQHHPLAKSRSLRQITEQAQRQGMTSRRGTPLSLATVARILKAADRWDQEQERACTDTAPEITSKWSLETPNGSMPSLMGTSPRPAAIR